MKYAIESSEKARASGTFSISHFSAVKVCRSINRMKFPEAKKSLEGLSSEETSLKGKHYTHTSKDILSLLNNLEKNAKNKNLDTTDLFLFISSHRGPTMHRARRKWRKFGSRLKSCHVQAVLSDKESFARIAPSKKAVSTK